MEGGSELAYPRTVRSIKSGGFDAIPHLPKHHFNQLQPTIFAHHQRSHISETMGNDQSNLKGGAPATDGDKNAAAKSERKIL
jgi:hypothetical protein